MEKLTTDRQKYFDRIIEELNDIQHDSKLIYTEVGQLLTHGFSFSYQDDQSSKAKMKIWNAEYDNKRFALGVFNLDRLAINEIIMDLTSDELNQLNQLVESKIDTKEFKGIVLDGLFCQLKTNDLELTWNVDDEMNDNLARLIKTIRKKAFQVAQKNHKNHFLHSFCH